MKRGEPVRIRLDDGTVLAGHVWCEGPDEGSWWYALANGRWAKVSAGGRAVITDGLGHRTGATGVAA